MSGPDEMDAAEMREELAAIMQWGTDYTMDSCRMDVDRMTDGQVWQEWQRVNRPEPSQR